MVHEAVFGQLLVLRARPSVVGVGVNAYSAARRKQPDYLYIFRVHQLDQVLHDDVHAVFMEVSVVTETEKIQLQALTLYHADVGNIADAYLGEVGLTRNWAQ